MSRPSEAEGLAWRIASFIDSSLGGWPSESFEDLALDIHRWQVAHDPVLAALVASPVRDWSAIPAVPIALFRELPVGTVGAAEAGATFRTSGTTSGARGVHHLHATDLYDQGALAWARRCVPDAPTDIVALLTAPTAAPDSSLSHMIASFAAEPGGVVTWHLVDGELDREGVRRRIVEASGPLYVACTAFAAAAWLDGDVPRLPAGSVVMVTGGFKGRHTALDDAGLYQAIAERLAPGRIVTEYGMTELSSQLWGRPLGPYAPPPWLRVQAVDPVTGDPRRVGRSGQLRFFDLCNLDGTLAIETLDEGVVHEDGSVTLVGRLPNAPARGCSLTVEEAWARRGR